MATKKQKKYPKVPKAIKKPKANASIAGMEKYLERVDKQAKDYKEKCKQIDKLNAEIVKSAKKADTLRKSISGVKRITKK